MVTVGEVRRVVRRLWAPSRAMAFRASFRLVGGCKRRVLEGGRGLGSVVVRCARS